MQIHRPGVAREQTPFIGRVRERQALIEEVRRGAGLVSIIGPSGIGKTRLARQVAGEVVDSFQKEGGAWFCSLGACRTIADVEGAISRSIRLPPLEGDAFLQAISQRGPMLLILDNIDGIVDQLAPPIKSWLERCVKLQMLATSILPIEIEGEIRFELGPLEAEDAVELYLERAHRAWSGRVVTADEGPVVQELVGRLDRIPLAIELAAARVRVLPPSTLLSRIDERLELLHSDTPGRHGSLLEALALTWSLLSEKEKSVLSKLSVFRGGFTAKAAAAILDEDRNEHQMLDLFDNLRSKALMQIEEGESVRFSLFETIQEYASRELARIDPEETILLRHGSYFVEKGEEEAVRLEGAGFYHSLEWLKEERDNLESVLHLCATRAPDLAARAGLVLFSLLAVEGIPPSALRLMQATLDAARRSRDPRLIALALEGHSLSLAQLSRNDEALSGLLEALEHAKGIEDIPLEGQILLKLGSIHVTLGDIEAAIPPIERARAIGSSTGDALLEVKALIQKATLEFSRQATDEGERLYEEMMEILRHQDFVRVEITVLTFLAGIKFKKGRFREARRIFQELLARSRQIGNRMREATTLLNLGGLELSAGALDESEARSLEALAILRELGQQRREAVVLSTLGVVALERGDLELAEERLVSSVGLFEDCGDKIWRASVLPFVAVVEARAGRFSEAERSMEDARTFFTENGDLESLALVELLEGNLELAKARRIGSSRSKEREELVESARQRLCAAQAERTHRLGTMYQAIRLLEQALDRWEEETRANGGLVQVESLRIGPSAAWFEFPGGSRVDIRRRMAIRRILDHLAEKRLSAPGQGSQAHDLFDVGWPGVDIDLETAIRRVYLGVWYLRDLGLSGVLLNQTDGYLLDPSVPLLRVEE